MIPRLFAPSQDHHYHHKEEQLRRGDLEDYGFGEQNERLSQSESGSFERTATFTSTSPSTTTKKPSWGEILSMHYLKSMMTLTSPFASSTSARSGSMSLPPYHRLPQRTSRSPSPSRRQKGGLRSLPVATLSSIPRRYYKTKLLCAFICAIFFCILYRGFGGEDTTDPPLYPEYFAYEDSLIQHHSSTSSPLRAPAKTRYLHFANHNYLLGFNNHLGEYMLNAHLAFLANRSFVAHEYTWNSNWETEPFSVWNGRKIPSRIPESVVLGGWVGAAVRQDFRTSVTTSTVAGSGTVDEEEEEEAQDDLTPVSRPYYEFVCPLSDRVYINAREVMNSYLSEYVDIQIYPDIEAKKVSEGDVMMILKAWVERLSREDVKDAKCVEVKRDSGHVFDLWLFGSPRLHPLWPSLVRSPILQHWSFSPLIYGAFQRNLVGKEVLGASVKRGVIEGLKNDSKKVEEKPIMVNGIKYDEFGYPEYPGGYEYPPIYTPPSPSSLSSSLGFEEVSNFPFTQQNITVSPYPRTPDGALPILALHLRRGDFEEHCDNLAEWGSRFMGFASFGEFTERDRFVPPQVDGSVSDVSNDAFHADSGEDDVGKSALKDVATGMVNIQLSSPASKSRSRKSKPNTLKVTSSSSFRGHRFSDTDPLKVKNVEARKRVVVGRHCYPETKQVVKRVRQVVHDWVGGRYVKFIQRFEESQLAYTTPQLGPGLNLHNAGAEYEKALEGWKKDTLKRLKAVYVMTNGDKTWAEEVREALRKDVGRWEFRVEVDVGVSMVEDPTSDEGASSEGHAMRKRVLEWIVEEWPWDTDPASDDIVITTTRDLELRKEEKYVAQAVDMYIGQRSEVFIGNGFSSMTANVVILRKKSGLDSVQTRFW